MGQMAAALANRPGGSLLSNIKKNPKKQANAITLRSGRQLEQQQSQNIDAKSLDKAKEENKNETKKFEESAIQQTSDPLSERLNRLPEDEAAPEPEPMKKAPVKPYVPPVPFPQRLQKQNTEKQFS